MAREMARMNCMAGGLVISGNVANLPSMPF